MAGAKSQKLEDQAANAALYDTKGDKGNKHRSNYPLDEENKLSSAGKNLTILTTRYPPPYKLNGIGAAASLKHADPRDLPSFPSTGFTDKDAWAGTAANLANANQKPFEYWKPDPSASANKAALLAKDYKAAPLWHPELSAAGSKAALLAAKDGGHVNIWRPEPTDAGNSAAGQAMRMKELSPQVYQGVTTDESKRALLAATGAMSGSRRRAGSMPVVNPAYPDSANSAVNALSAATAANKPSDRTTQPRSGALSAIDAGRIHNAAVTNLSREMYTSHPPVAPEVEEKNRQAGLRAAAMSMAKQMYDVQQKAIEAASTDLESAESRYAATSVHNRQASTTPAATAQQSAPQYVKLQEAAQKLAAERLAKLHDEHAAYRNYYGAATPPQSRLSIRGRTRRRASSDGQIDESDAARSRQIRSEMSLFNDKLAQVDATKRQKDRDSLIAAAQRNVKASMHGMDERVFNETGKASPAMMEEWEAKASARAKADSEARMVNHGRVNIGGGKYLDQSEIDAIAAKRVQPTLDEISAKAEKQRARDEQLRQEQLVRERIAAEKAQDQKERDLKTKEEWKKFREEEKREAKAKKEEEKAKKAEEKRLREEKRRAKETPVASAAVVQTTEERPTTATEPPVLDPIPTVEPLSAEEPDVVSLSEEPSPVEPSAISTEPLRGTITPPVTDPDHAEEVATRVLSAPVVDEDPPPVPDITSSGTLDQAVAVPLPSDEPSTGAVPEDQSEPSTTMKPITVTKPPKPTEHVTSRTTPAPTTQTTITGPSSTSKEPKGESKISSWLKSKLSSSRSTKSAKNPETKEVDPERSTKEKSFVGGSNLTATNTVNNSSLDPPASSSAREGPTASHPPAAAVLPGPAEHDDNDDDDLYAASEPHSPSRHHDRSHSHSSFPSISSVSSDEDTRGRSTMPRHGTTESNHDDDDEEEFEEALDHFDNEELAPPPAVLGETGRVGGSPVRDSKFQEIL